MPPIGLALSAERRYVQAGLFEQKDTKQIQRICAHAEKEGGAVEAACPL